LDQGKKRATLPVFRKKEKKVAALLPVQGKRKGKELLLIPDFAHWGGRGGGEKKNPALISSLQKASEGKKKNRFLLGEGKKGAERGGEGGSGFRPIRGKREKIPKGGKLPPEKGK